MKYNNIIIYEKKNFVYKKKKISISKNIRLKFIFFLFLLYVFLFIYSKYKFINNIKKPNTYISNTQNKKKLVKLRPKIPYSKNNYEKKIFISILIPNFDIINSDKTDSKILILKNLLKQSIKDFEILLSFKNKNTTLFNKAHELSKSHQQIKIFINECDIYNNTIKLILKSKGKFVSVLKKNMNISDNQLYEKMNYKTYGKIKNIYEYKIENETNYLIKNKILKDIIDKEITFNNFDNIEKYIKLMPELNLNYISIAYSLDNKYFLFGYISIISILETKNFNTFISLYIIVQKNFNKYYQKIIYSLYDDYDFLNISIIYMDDRYKNVKQINYLNQNAYYRLSLGELLPNLNKIIYLDSDILVYEDLSNFFNMNFNGYIMLSTKKPRELNITENFRLNSGVLLLNLKKMRDIKMEENVIKLINQGFTSNVQDQELLIKYYFNLIGELKEKYNVPNTGFDLLINFYNEKNNKNKIDDLIFTLNHPVIKHFNGPKKSKKYIYSYDWLYFASKAKYYLDLLKNKNCY